MTSLLVLGGAPRSEINVSSLPRAIDFIHEARLAGGVVLVHCYHGVSRSGAVVLAYLTAHLGCTIFQAWHYVLALCGKNRRLDFRHRVEEVAKLHPPPSREKNSANEYLIEFFT